MKLKIIYIEGDKADEFLNRLQLRTPEINFYLDGEEVFYFIEVEQMPNKDVTLFTYFGICIIEELYFSLEIGGAHEIYVTEK
jgi:hypothetical protein